jgi:anti-sigma regulatory factor (Ser/Thr protein kinase)
LIEAIEDLVRQWCRAPDEVYQSQVAIALEEALTNALIHGNLEIGSEWRDDSSARYYELINTRPNHAPYRDRRVHFDALLSRKGLRFVVRDEGPGFDIGNLPDPRDPANLEKPYGRGVLLMRHYMDRVVYNDVGNQVTMIKRCALQHVEA